MPTIEMQWLREINWPLLQAGFPFMREVRLRMAAPRWDFVTIDATVESRRLVLGRWHHQAPLLDGQDLTVDAPQFTWDFNHSLHFIEDTTPVPAELKLTVRTGTQERPTVYTFTLAALHVLSPKQWNAGIGIRTDVDGTLGVYSSYPYYQCSASLREHTSTSVPEACEQDLTSPQQLALTPQQLALTSNIAALCMPSHETIAQLDREAIAALCELLSEAEAEPEELGKSDWGRKLLLRALYGQLRKKPLAPALEDVSFADPDPKAVWTQRVRLPDELTKEPLGQLTCIDWALLTAAVCERWQIAPLLLLVQQGLRLHAVTAIRTIAAPRSNAPRPAAFILSPGEAATMLAVDFTERRGFPDAIKAASECLASAKFGIAIDLSAARDAGCHPLPLHQKLPPLPRVDDPEFHERYYASAPLVLQRYYNYTAASHMSPEEIFVPLTCDVLTYPALGSLDALTYLRQQTASPASKIAILAQSGAGKSYLLARLFLEKLEAYHADPASTSLPVFFPLKKLVPSHPIECQLYEYVYGTGSPAVSEETFYQALTDGKYAVYLDALDEMPLYGGAEVEQLLERIAPLRALANLELVLTARFGLFGSKTLSLLPDCHVLLLHEWGQEHWGAFLDLLAPGHISQGEATALKTLEGPIRELITKPLYCQMIVEERAHVLQYGIRNAAELFQRYISKFWRRAVPHEFLTPKEKNACMRDIAAQMEYQHQWVWTINQLTVEINRKYPHLSTPDEWQRYLTNIRVYSFLDTSVSVAQEDEFSFSHVAFREFFLAEHLLARLHAGDLQALADLRISLEAARMIGGLLDLEQHNPIQLLLSALSKPGAKGTYRARNLALIHIALRESCAGWKLDKADFSGLDLRGTDFAGCFLTGAEFLNCDLRDCRFDGAHLNKAKFEDSKLAGASFQATQGKPSFINCV